jgi:hypothetical protein
MNQGRIGTVALLPLGLASEGDSASGLGLMEYWNENFPRLFRRKAAFHDGTRVLYPGVDFEFVGLGTGEVDYDGIRDALGVDAVIGFELLAYREARVPSLDEIKGRGTYMPRGEEQSAASIRIHTSFLGIEDWAPVVSVKPGGVLRSEAEFKAIVVNYVLDWLDRNHPLSSRYLR